MNKFGKPQSFWIHVHNASHKTFHDAKFTVNANDDQHEEEDDCPDAASSHLEDDLGIGDEDEAGSTVDDILDLDTLIVSHVSKDAEGDNSSKKTCSSVDKTGDDSILYNSYYTFLINSPESEGLGR